MGLAFLWFKMAFRQVWNMRFDGVELPFQFNGMKKLLIILFALMPLAVLAEGRDDFAGALWIGAVADANDSLSDRSIILSKTFRNDLKKVRKAEAFVCGLGAYELYIDGRCISPDEVLSPAWSDYNKTVFYNVLDVTDCLNRVRQGGSHAGGKKAQLSKITDSIEHNVEVWLGNGFFHESGRRYHKLTTNYGPLTLLFCLRIEYADGSVTDVTSDGSWQWRRSPVTYNSIYGGEDYDTRLWRPSLSADAHAVVQKAPCGILRRQVCEPVRIMERFSVKAKLLDRTDSTGHCTVVYDMGQNLSGFPEIVVRGRRGMQFTLTVGETLRRDGLIGQKQTGKPYYYVYTCGGAEAESWHPRFSYYSFRYVQIDYDRGIGGVELPSDSVIISLHSDFIYNAAASRMASFSCSNPLLNKTFDLVNNAVKSNWMTVWTDCPAREKLGWLEQDWLNGPGLMTDFDCRKMIEQEMIVIADAQHADGSMPEIAPEYIRFEGSWAPPFRESPEWGGALVALPFLYKQVYGDDKLVVKYLPQMRRYVDYLANRDSAGILSIGLGDWYDYGPWRAGFSRNTPLALVSTAHYYLWTRLVGLSARADSIRSAFLVAGFRPSSQAAIAIMLDLGLYHEGQRQALLDSLVADIHRHGDRLTTGDVGTPYLFRTLIRSGQEDLLYKMLNHYDVPGYGAQLRKGLTTLSEQWDPDRGASRNHFMLGHINNHLVPDVAGIHLENGRARIAPTLMGDLRWARATAYVGSQRVAVSWSIDNGVFNLCVESPEKNIITIDYEKINTMCVRRHLRLHYKFKRSE